MNEPITASEAKQIMDLLQSMDKKLDIHIVKTEEQFNTIRAEFKAEVNSVQQQIKSLDGKVDSLPSELRDDINELRTQQRSTDTRLWTFIVGLVTLVGGGVIKVLWFDRA
ncbi:hemagglutinin [Candidatus Synechococcus calcipolaris G9]|uniref:Hemagglutinin n=1 Tax=Candidatus Synechococcus calcipolaris G9 TaxID=1497997 RepID=A0ABT6F0J7_9SYNE|nr:hemagglutinin [Candidatus Synechococcus calcipolaris]MDG2991391.1 hemagglutinin [Candidatus Synechococcus calcipolaris G9]